MSEICRNCGLPDENLLCMGDDAYEHTLASTCIASLRARLGAMEGGVLRLERALDQAGRRLAEAEYALTCRRSEREILGDVFDAWAGDSKEHPFAERLAKMQRQAEYDETDHRRAAPPLAAERSAR